jgi:hypothetical protein
MSFEQTAVRLAGGFVRLIGEESLRTAIHTVLPATPMGALESIKMLPALRTRSIRLGAPASIWPPGPAIIFVSADYVELWRKLAAFGWAKIIPTRSCRAACW